MRKKLYHQCCSVFFFFWDHVYTWTKLKYLLLFIPFFFVNIWWESWWILLICRTCNHMSNIASLQIFSKFIVSKKCFPGCTRNLRFPLENLGVAPVLCRSSSQTLYLCVGVNIGVSSILWCDLHAIETTNVPVLHFSPQMDGMVSAILYTCSKEMYTWNLLRIILFYNMNIVLCNNYLSHTEIECIYHFDYKRKADSN